MRSDTLANASKLVRMHKEAEPNLERAFLLTSKRDDNDDEPIKVLEIVEGAVESGIMPVFFHADARHGIPFTSVVIELSPAEYRAAGRPLRIPGEDWEIGPELPLR